MEIRRVKGDPHMVNRLPRQVQRLLNLPADLLLLSPQAAGQRHIKHQIHVALSRNHPEVVEGQAGIPDGKQLAYLLLQLIQRRIIGNDRIVVNDQMYIVAAQAFPLHIINGLMALQRVFPVVHFHINTLGCLQI